MDLTMLTTRFGMDASTTEAQFIAQVDVWKRKADRVDMLEKTGGGTQGTGNRKTS